MDTTAIAGSEDAPTIIQELHDHAFKRLRDVFPFMKVDAIDRVLEDFTKSARTNIEAQQPAMKASRKKFDFFSIPAELRDLIYEHILFDNKQDIIVRIPLGRLKDEASFKWPTIVKVNRQMRDETLPMFLGQNTFLAPMTVLDNGLFNSCDRTLGTWTRMLGFDRTKFIKKLVIKCEYTPMERLRLRLENVRDQEAAYRRARDGVPDSVPISIELEPLHVNKKSVIRALRADDYGMAHDAFELLYSDSEGLKELLDDGSSRLIKKYDHAECGSHCAISR